jgi:hypothetical protein
MSAVLVLGSIGCDEGGPSAPSGTASEGSAPVVEKGKTPEGLKNSTKARKPPIKTLTPTGPG